MPSFDSDRVRRYLSGGCVSGLGLLILLVPLYDIWDDLRNLSWGLLWTLLENSALLVLAFGLVLAERFPDGVVALFDEQPRFYHSAGEAFDRLPIDPEDLDGRTPREGFDDEFAETVTPALRDALDGDRERIEIEYADRHWLVRTIPVTDDDGAVSAGMMMVQDVTDLISYQRRVEASNERLEQFASAVSHDLQEPLRMVSSYLELLEDRYGDDLDEDGEEFIEYAVDGADRMREMIDGLLQYSRVETEGDSLEPVDLNAVLADVRADLQVKLEESDAVLTVDDLPRVRGDASQLRQVFQNLLENALEYSGDEPPRVHVSADRDGTEWVVSVRDEGIGLDPDHADRIFRMFERLHTNDEHAGTGIGLALCQRIVERHGGEIWVDAEPGDGTTFTLTLPALEDELERETVDR